MAVMALGAPSLLRKRRYCAPRYVWLLSRVEAPRRRAVAARIEDTTGSPCEHFVSTDVVVWAEAQPGSKVCFAFPSTHVQPHFTDHCLRYHDIDAVDARQIHSGDALEFLGMMEVRIILVLFVLLFRAAQSALSLIGLSSPNRIPHHTGKGRNPRQVSGTSDASKTQSMLIRGSRGSDSSSGGQCGALDLLDHLIDR